jgi:hypothetical protein
MAKGQLTDQELESSLKSLGGLGGIAASGARRDSPFGSEYVKKTATAEEGAPKPPEEPAVVKTVELRAVKETTVDPVPTGEPLRAMPTRPRTVAVPTKAKPVEKPLPVEPPLPISSRKSDSFSERVTLQMSPDMRDSLNLLAAKLQRKKTDKTERITANTLMRVAIQVLLDDGGLAEGEVANTEADLLRIVRKRLSRPK